MPKEETEKKVGANTAAGFTPGYDKFGNPVQVNSGMNMQGMMGGYPGMMNPGMMNPAMMGQYGAMNPAMMGQHEMMNPAMMAQQRGVMNPAMMGQHGMMNP